MMGEWSVGQCIMGVISFQKMYGLYDKQTNDKEYRATQLLICEKLNLAMLPILVLFCYTDRPTDRLTDSHT